MRYSGGALRCAESRQAFHAFDPDNRLVADELERRWNVALEQVRGIEARLDEQSVPMNQHGATVEEFAELANDLETAWNSPEADAQLKKRIVRALIEEVVADSDAEAGEIVLQIYWKGGVHTELRLPRRRRGQVNPTSKDAIEAIRSLARICRDDVLAGVLNRNGLKTGRGNRWTRGRVAALRNRNKIPCYCKTRCAEEGWLKLNEAADVVGVSSVTLRLAIEQGEVPGEHPLPDGPWVINRQELESKATQALVQRARRRTRVPAKPNPLQQDIDFSST